MILFESSMNNLDTLPSSIGFAWTTAFELATCFNMECSIQIIIVNIFNILHYWHDT